MYNNFEKSKMENTGNQISGDVKKMPDNNDAYNLTAALADLKRNLNLNMHLNREIIWANIFHDTIADSSWFKNQALSPGRWAIGYQFAYVLYRALDEARPKSILELGLGQSTKFTAQYIAANPDASHIVIEHDESWISFFSRNYSVPETTKIQLCPLAFEKYKNADSVRTFEGFHEIIKGKKFDLILIDAPMGGDMKQYARIDVLKEMPDCLADSFIILLDDYNRPTEKLTAAEMLKVLQDNNIKYFTGIYSGEKDTYVICSEDNKFVKTM